eukprot:2605905-Pyramimonas_sp.AAC.1
MDCAKESCRCPQDVYICLPEPYGFLSKNPMDSPKESGGFPKESDVPRKPMDFRRILPDVRRIPMDT